MKKMTSPWKGKENEGYNCFGCAPNNPCGLHMEFYEDGDEVVSFWEPQSHFQSWVNVVHGGVQCTLMDEAAGWLVIHHMDTCGVTSKMEVKFMKPLPALEGPVEVRARLVKTLRNIAVVEVWILTPQKEKAAMATMHYFMYPQNIAVEKFSYTTKDKCNCEH